MYKLIQFLKNFNKKTNNDALLALIIIVDIILSVISTMYGNIFMSLADNPPVGAEYFLLFMLNSMIYLVIGALIWVSGAASIGLVKWFKNTIIKSFKEAAKEDYDIQPKDKAKVNFN